MSYNKCIETETNCFTKPRNFNAAIVLVAKCPLVGKSKTRLAKDDRLGNDGAADLARAMLSDVLDRVGRCVSLFLFVCSCVYGQLMLMYKIHDIMYAMHAQPSFKKVLKILLYAPGDAEGESIMSDLLASLKLDSSSSSPSSDNTEASFNTWVLMPMNSTAKDMTSSNLGDKLKSALYRARQLLINCRREPNDTKEDGGVVFIGMDAPDIPLDEILHGILYSSPPHNQAFLCPTYDGGYGMIAVPANAPLQIFDGVRWSDPLTTTSQIKSLSDWNIPLIMGKMMYDVDEPEDSKYYQDIYSFHKL